MNTQKRKAWKEFLMENVNFAALRLLFTKQTDADMRAALDWEKEHH